MLILDTGTLATQLASFASSWANKAVDDHLARVNTCADHHAARSSGNGPDRTRDYTNTPGTVRQSFAPWLKGVRDIFIDDVRAVRRAPDDVDARIRLMLSTALYAHVGDAFTDIVVDVDALPDTDPLARPPLPVKTKRASALRANHLSPAQQQAVLDAVTDDPGRVSAARDALTAIVQQGSEAEAQIAAALLGQIGDPLNRSKLNRLAWQIEELRWKTAGAPPAAHRRPESASSAATAAAARPGYPQAQVVRSGGEDARRLAPANKTSTMDDLAAHYGEES